MLSFALLLLWCMRSLGFVLCIGFAVVGNIPGIIFGILVMWIAAYLMGRHAGSQNTEIDV